MAGVVQAGPTSCACDVREATHRHAMNSRSQHTERAPRAPERTDWPCKLAQRCQHE
jgi:hypothetical protein